MHSPVPSEWAEVLSKVQRVFPLAVIAGGALRDTVGGRTIKDVDVFIPCTITPDEAYEQIWQLFEGQDIILDERTAYGVKTLENKDRDILGVFKLQQEQFQYDLIVCTPGAADVNTFDINICQISYNGISFDYTKHFVEGFMNREIKVMNINRSDRNQKRLLRLMEKYPEFTVEEDSICPSSDLILLN